MSYEIGDWVGVKIDDAMRIGVIDNIWSTNQHLLTKMIVIIDDVEIEIDEWVILKTIDKSNFDSIEQAEDWFNVCYELDPEQFL